MTRKQITKSLGLALAAIALAVVAQTVIVQPDHTLGWILHGIAAGLFIAAFGTTPVTSRPWASPRARAAGRRAAEYSPALLVLSAVATVTSMALFGQDRWLRLAWWLFLGSIALFVAAVVAVRGPRGARKTSAQGSSRSVLTWLPLVALLTIAAAIRLWDLNAFPFGLWYDEAANGLVAQRILTEPGFLPVYVAETQLPAHFNYLVAVSIALFGSSAAAVRLVSAMFGTLAVLFAYLLFRRWFGQGIGTLAALLLAVLRYHLTFSRLGMAGVSTPAFELAALYFLDRALSNKRIADFAWLGLALGLGLGFYFAFRLFVAVLALFLLALLAASILKYGRRLAVRRYVRSLSAHWLVAALGLVIAIGPVAQLTIRRPDLFLARTKTVSIFNQRDEPDLGKALWSNTVKHLEMFNVRGDGNGRHNLPGAPMLDPILGMLAALGLAYSVWRWRDPPNALMLMIFFGALMAGILTLDFEAPQSYRSIGVIPALIYMAVVPIGLLSRSTLHFLERKRPPARWGIPDLVWQSRHMLGTLVLIGVIGCIGWLELNTFFVRQRNDPAAWAAYSTPETLAAKIINQNVDNYDFVVGSSYFDPPTTRFLASPEANVQRWTVGDRLPLVRDATDRGVMMMFEPNLVSEYRDAERLYPQAQFIEHHAPAGGGTVMYQVILSPEILRSAQGVTAQYFLNDGEQDVPTAEETVGNLAVDWTSGQPLGEDFTAQLTSTLFAPAYGDYQFEVRGSLDAQLFVDEYPVPSQPFTLAHGTHAIRLQVAGGRGRSEVWWTHPEAAEAERLSAAYLFLPPVSSSGLLGTYYPTPDWSDPPAFTQIDPQIAYYFHIIPLARPYSVRWTGKLFAPTTGEYEFELYSVDGSWLNLDGSPVVENPDGRTSVRNSVILEEGWHDLMLDFSDQTSGTQIYLYWAPPGGARELVPSRYLRPPMGQYPASP